MKNWINHVRSTVHDETGGTTSKREKARIIGSLLKNKISTKASEAKTKVSEKAMNYHDHILLKRHEASLASQANANLTNSGTNLRVELVAAADLRTSAVGDPDPYCMLTIGISGHAWTVKVANNPQVKTRVALRERHPRWNSTVIVPMSEAVCSNFVDTELTVRVMDAHTTRSDTVLGEARVALGSEPFGARTVRLHGGGFASLSLRWSLSADQEDTSDLNEDAATDRKIIERLRVERKWRELLQRYPFEGAATFWAEHSAGGRVGAQELAELALVLSHDPSVIVVDTPQPKPLLEDIDEDGLVGASDVLCDDVVRLTSTPLANESLCDSVAVEPPEAVDALELPLPPNFNVNELILQAPLGGVLSGDAVRVSVFVDALEGHLQDLTLLARSRLIGALIASLRQGLDDAIQQSMEKLLHDLFTQTTGSDLVDLKRLVDTGGIGQDLMAACNALSKSTLHWSLVESLLDHFYDEASRLEQKTTHVLSDIDMTVWIGAFGSGGQKFPKGPVPGALSLYELLGGRITFLSARPPIWESRTRGALLNDIGIAEATLLQGTLQNVAKALYHKEAAHKGMGEQKEKVFNQFAALHPDARFVFFGDSGEGDVDFALAFMGNQSEIVYPPDHKYEDCPDRLAFIHDVVASDGIEPKTSAAQRESLRVRGVHIFDTYLGAAKQLFLYGLFDKWDLQCAAERLVQEFAQILPEEFKSVEIFQARQEELERDLAAVNGLLGNSGFLDEAREMLQQASHGSRHGYPCDSLDPSLESVESTSAQQFPPNSALERIPAVAESGTAKTLKSGDSSDSDDEPLLT